LFHLEGCKDTTLILGAGIITGVVEIWDCTSVHVHVMHFRCKSAVF